MKAKKKLVVLIIGICIIGGSIVLMMKPKQEKEVKREREHTVVVDDITVGIDGGGAAKLEEVEHNFKISGTIEEIYVNKAQKIQKGDKIAKISDKPINSQIEELKIEQKNKSENINQLKEQKKNSPDDTSIDSQISTVQGELDIVNKKIKNLKSDLDNLYVYAKIDGVVLDIGYEQEAEATPSKAVAVIGNEEKIYIDVLLPQTEIISINENQEVKVTFETYPDIEVKGIVEEKSYISSGEGEDVDYKVRAKLDTENLEIYQGMTAEVKFIIKNKEDVVQVPNKAIKVKGNKQIVKVKENEQIKEVEVKTGFSDGSVTEILDGLQEGQTVVEER